MNTPLLRIDFSVSLLIVPPSHSPLLLLIPFGLPANVKDAESDSLNEECAHELLVVFEDYMSFLGFSHVIVLTIVLPTGVFAYIQWLKWRQRSKRLKPIEKVRVPQFCLLDVGCHTND